MQDNQGKTVLHFAVQKCNPKIVVALLSRKDIYRHYMDCQPWFASSLVTVERHISWQDFKMGKPGRPKDTMESDTMSTSSSSSSGEEEPGMELLQGPQIYRELLKAASCGDSRSMQALASQNPNFLLGTTPWGNTCLHISCIHGHEGFCKDVLQREEFLLSAINLNRETPLVIAIARGHVSLVSFLLERCCCSKDLAGGFRQTILQQDMDGCNALHHAIHSGHRGLALELIAAEPALSHGVNKYNESPMFVAVMRNWADVFEKLLEIPDSAHVGNNSNNAMHAAVRNGNSEIARKIMEKRPGLARAPNMDSNTPIGLTVLWDKIDVLRVLLEHDSSLGYVIDEEGFPLLASAAYEVMLMLLESFSTIVQMLLIAKQMA